MVSHNDYPARKSVYKQKERTMATSKKVKSNFTSKNIIGLINAGSLTALEGWWNAYADFVVSGAETVSEYAKASVNDDWSENTIGQMVGYVKWANEMGYKRSEFKSMSHLRTTKASYNDDNGNKRNKKTTPTKRAENDLRRLRNELSPSQIEEYARYLLANARKAK